MPTAFPFPTGTVGAANQILQTHTFRDSKGFTSVVRYYINPNAAVEGDIASAIAAILTALKALTNAAYQGSQGYISEYGVKQYGASGTDYPSCRMKARLVYQDLAGGLHALSVPAPKLACFDADRQTVLPSGVATLNGLIATPGGVPASGTPYVSSRQGVQITNFMGGFFTARQRRANKLFLLSGALTAGEPGD